MNVQSYFLIVLGGFGIVWAYRKVKYRNTVVPGLSEFEYAAFSAIWGSVYLYLAISILLREAVVSQAQLNDFYAMPFVVTPILFVCGVSAGAVAGYIPSFSRKALGWPKAH